MDYKQRSLLPATLPVPPLVTNTHPDTYLLDEQLERVVSVALSQRQPLLLTGERGSGKTQLVTYLAYKYNLAQVFKFTTKSNSTARDLFYIYDILGRFHAGSQAKINSENEFMPSKRAVDYITYNALGKAIILSHPKEKVKDYLPIGFKHNGPQRSMVLIDDIDKAPRDFPNDILNELDAMYFGIPELGNVTIEADPRYQPIVVITSDFCKVLPYAFLRRCIYYHIPFPAREKLELIVKAHMANLTSHETTKNKTQQIQIEPTKTGYSVNINTMLAAANDTLYNTEILTDIINSVIINDPNNKFELIKTLEQLIQKATVRLKRLEAIQLAAQDLLDKL